MQLTSGPQLIRSLLFTPADAPGRFGAAAHVGADALVIDLEDSVALSWKDAARAAAVDYLAAPQRHRRTFVRVNAMTEPAGLLDVRAVAGKAPDAIVVPKAEISALAALPDGAPPVVALIETPLGVLQAFEIARHDKVVGVMLGPVDLAAALGVDVGARGTTLRYAADAVVVSTRAAGLDAPLDGPTLELADDQQLRDDTRRAASAGFGGKACVHPRQVGVVNDAFRPEPERVEHAARLVAAFEEAAVEGRGVISFEGEMVDAPVVERARQLLAVDRACDV